MPAQSTIGPRERAPARVREAPRNAPRKGRALVECVVSIFLLAVAVLSTAATTRGTLALADDSIIVAHAQALAVTRAEAALVAPCATAMSGFDQVPRIGVTWRQFGTGATTLTHLDVMLERSALATAASTMTLSIEGGGVCP